MSLMRWTNTARDTQDPCRPFGKVDATSLPRKKKIKGKRLLDDAFISTYDALPQALWYNYFIEDKGCIMEQNIILKDKKVLYY